MNEHLLTTEQVAQHLQISEDKVRELCHNSGLPYYPLGPKLWRFDGKEVNDWLERQRTENTNKGETNGFNLSEKG